MSTLYTSNITNVEAHLLQQADALLTYAATDPIFAESLAHHVQLQEWELHDVMAQPVSTYLTPTTQTKAITIAHWLLAELDRRPETACTRGLLATWASTYAAPKNLVLGIVGLAIIGPTLGLIDTKKKKKQKMQLLVEQEWIDKFDPEQIVEKTHELSQIVCAQELRLACGVVDRLHPDTADWLMTGSGTKLYRTNPKTIEKIIQTIETENVPHLLVAEDDRIVAVCLAPSVQDTLVDDLI